MSRRGHRPRDSDTNTTSHQSVHSGVPVMRKIFALTTIALVAGAVSPAYAQTSEAAAVVSASALQWVFITSGFALAIAAAFGALAQGKAVSSAVEGMARNPGASGEIRGALILGLV